MTSLYPSFRLIALELIAEGRDHYSADGIIHVIRFNTRHESDGKYKCNNNDAAIFARQFIREFPQYAEFFNLRRSKHDQMGITFNQQGQGVMGI